MNEIEVVIQQPIIEVKFESNLNTGGGGSGTVESVNNVLPDGNGNVEITTADINDSSNRRYVTDAQQTVIGNTSGTNTGDDATNTTSNSYADGKVADSITDGVTTVAPSQNAVFDALALKENALGFTPENVANKATNFGTINDTLYPSVQAVNNRYECLQRTGTSIAFDRPANYGTIASPETGNITGDYTGARIGIQQLIIHNHSVAPTIPATWEQLVTSSGYRVSVVNYIYIEWISGNIATFTISQKLI